MRNNNVKKKIIRKKSTLKLDPVDAAIVFKEKYPFVTFTFPEFEDEEEVPHHVIICIAIALRLKDQEWVDELLTWFDQSIDEENINEFIENRGMLH